MADSEHPGAVRTEEVLERLDYGFPLNGVGTSASPAVSKIVPHVWKLWESRRLLARIAGRALVVSTLVVFLIPVEYKSTTRFMPSDQGQSGGSLLAALAGSKTSSSSSSYSSPLLGIAGDVLGMKSGGALYVA